MPQSENSKRWNERSRKDERNRRILVLARTGLSNSEIARVLEADGEPISRQRVGKILKDSLAEAASERLDIAREVFDLELERLSWVIQQSTRIITDPCKSCEGQGTFQNGEHCDVCKGDGRSNHPDTRLRAMKEVRNAIHQRSQMLGLYAPEKFAFTDTEGNDLRPELRRELESMSIEDLDRAIADFQAGIEAGLDYVVKEDLRIVED